jgi:hypothetical protein
LGPNKEASRTSTFETYDNVRTYALQVLHYLIAARVGCRWSCSAPKAPATTAMRPQSSGRRTDERAIIVFMLIAALILVWEGVKFIINLIVDWIVERRHQKWLREHDDWQKWGE